jgi:hypothetical protein
MENDWVFEHANCTDLLKSLLHEKPDVWIPTSINRVTYFRKEIMRNVPGTGFNRFASWVYNMRPSGYKCGGLHLSSNEGTYRLFVRRIPTFLKPVFQMLGCSTPYAKFLYGAVYRTPYASFG